MALFRNSSIGKNNNILDAGLNYDHQGRLVLVAVYWSMDLSRERKGEKKAPEKKRLSLNDRSHSNRPEMISKSVDRHLTLMKVRETLEG